MTDGGPCGHPGCLQHVSHPCEGCGRIAGHGIKGGQMTIEEIKQLLDGITPGKWYAKENGGRGELVGVASKRSDWFIAEEVKPGDADFIAAAPEAVRFLLTEVERQKIAQLREEGKTLGAAVTKAGRSMLRDDRAEVAKLRAEVERLSGENIALSTQCEKYERLAASRLADQEAIEKRVARECAEIAETFRTPYGSHPLLSGVQIGAVIRNKYGVE